MPRKRDDDGWDTPDPDTSALRFPLRWPEVHERRPWNRARIAYLIDEGRTSTMFLRGFDEVELDEVRAAVRMVWEPGERVWRFSNRDRPTVVAVLQAMEFGIHHLVEVAER